MNEMIGKSFNLYNLVIKDLQTETSCQQCTKLRNANCINCIIDILDFSCCLLSYVLHVTWVNLQKFGWGFIAICVKWMISQSTDYFIFCYTALTRSIWVRTAVHSCNLWLSVWTLSCRCPLQAFYVVISLLLFYSFYFWLIRSFTNPKPVNR